jgi:PhnB protein
MPESVKAVPEGFHTITSYFIVNNGKAFIDFVKNAFGAAEQRISTMPDGRIMHAQLKIGDSIIMMGEATNDWQPMPSVIYMYMQDIDEVYNNAISAGGKSLRQPINEFYGDRVCGIEDPTGNQWWIATHIEDVSPEEMKKRENEMMKR